MRLTEARVLPGEGSAVYLLFQEDGIEAKHLQRCFSTFTFEKSTNATRGFRGSSPRKAF